MKTIKKAQAYAYRQSKSSVKDIPDIDWTHLTEEDKSHLEYLRNSQVKHLGLRGRISESHWSSMARGCVTFEQFYTVWNLSPCIEFNRRAWKYLTIEERDRLKDWSIRAKEMDEQIF